MSDDNSRIIHLKKSDKVKETGLIKDAIYDIDTNNIRISLNHYANSDIVFTIDKKKWQNNHKLLLDEAALYGITDTKDTIELKALLNDNEKLILTDYNNNSDNEKLSEQDEEEGEERKSLAQVLVELVLENHIKLFKDEFNLPHIIVVINNHYQTLPIDSTKFKRYLSKLYYDTFEGRIANTEAINSAISQLEAKAFYEGQTISLYLRVAWDNPDTTSTIYYDLSDEKK